MEPAEKLKRISEKEAGQLEQIYLNLSRNGLLWENNLDWFIRNLCKSISDALNVERVGVYLLSNDNNSLRQQSVYTASTQQHSFGLNLKKKNYPNYFDALIKNRIIAADNALSHPSTKEFSNSYLTPLDIGAKLDCSLHRAGTVFGALSIEHVAGPRHWSEACKHFLSSLADLVSQRYMYEDLRKVEESGIEPLQLDDTILRASPFSVVSLDKQGQIKSCNRATLKLLGFAERDLVAQDFCAMLITTPDQREIKSTDSGSIPSFVTFNALKQQVNSGMAEDCECFLRHQNGESIPVKISIAEQQNSLHNITGYLCTITDISKQVNIRQALIEEEQRFRLVYESSAESIFLLKDNSIVDVNKATLNLFGATNKDMVGSSPIDFSPVVQPNGTVSRVRLNDYTKIARDNKTCSFEFQFKRLDETLFDAEITLNLIVINKQDYLLASLKDITVRKNAERALEESRQTIMAHNASLALINDLSNHLHAINSADEIYTRTIEALKHLPHNPRISIYEVKELSKELHYHSSARLSEQQVEDFKIIPFNHKFNTIPLFTGEPLYACDIATDDRLLPEVRDKVLEIGLNSLVEIPLIYQEHQMAVIILTYEAKNILSDEDIEALYSIGKTVSLALANAISRADLQHIAHHDSLTGLTNRSYFHDNFKRTILIGGYDNAALYLLDLDRFKEINDTLGHFTGDKILKLIGPRLNTVINDHEFIVSRLGGDEFIMVIYGVTDTETAEQIAEKIVKSLHQPFIVDDLSLEIDASVGIAMYPKDGMDSHALLRSADVAMYQAKVIGGGYSSYNQENDIHTPERLAMIAEMGSSITSGQLFLHYQPKIDLKTNKVTGFEALSRWDHPRLGMLGPNTFIPLIEMSNSIGALTEEVLHQALSQQMEWRKKGLDYSVAVNISARNLIDDKLVRTVADMLDFYDTPPENLELEITETALMHDAYRSVDFLKQLADMGVKLSIDDFGTGYSSLSYLQNLPVHKLKLDREFIMGMLNNEQGTDIVKTIISLAITLNLEVIAEGVEDEETLNKLREMNCDTAQGYYICRPNLWENIEHWLNRDNIH